LGAHLQNFFFQIFSKIKMTHAGAQTLFLFSAVFMCVFAWLLGVAAGS